MKREIPVIMARRLINPGNIVLITSANRGSRNILTLAWSIPLSHNRPYLGICVAKDHYSWELIKESREFHLNVPDSSLIEETLFCGKNSGKNLDKFKQTGLTPIKPEKIKSAPGILECVGHAECELIDEKDMGDHTLFIGQVLYAGVEEGMFGETWDVAKVKLIHHFGGSLFAATSEVIEVQVDTYQAVVFIPP